MAEEYRLKVIGWIESDLTQAEKAPPQGAGSGLEAWLVLKPEYVVGWMASRLAISCWSLPGCTLRSVGH